MTHRTLRREERGGGYGGEEERTGEGGTTPRMVSGITRGGVSEVNQDAMRSLIIVSIFAAVASAQPSAYFYGAPAGGQLDPEIFVEVDLSGHVVAEKHQTDIIVEKPKGLATYEPHQPHQQPVYKPHCTPSPLTVLESRSSSSSSSSETQQVYSK